MMGRRIWGLILVAALGGGDVLAEDAKDEVVIERTADSEGAGEPKKEKTLGERLAGEWSDAETKEYTVIRGDSVWKIVNKIYGDCKYKQEMVDYIAGINELDEHLSLNVDQKLKLPDVELPKLPLRLKDKEPKEGFILYSVVDKDDPYQIVLKHFPEADATAHRDRVAEFMKANGFSEKDATNMHIGLKVYVPETWDIKG